MATTAEDVELMEKVHPELATRARQGDVAAAAELNRLVSAYALLRSCEFLEPDPDKPGAFRRKSLPELKADEDTDFPTEISKALKAPGVDIRRQASLAAGVFADIWAFESRSTDSNK